MKKKELKAQLRALRHELKVALCAADEDEQVIEKLEQTIEKLASRLPPSMQDCTIRFYSCSKGHGRLTATNWADEGCLQCTIDRRDRLIQDLKNESLEGSNAREVVRLTAKAKELKDRLTRTAKGYEDRRKRDARRYDSGREVQINTIDRLIKERNEADKEVTRLKALVSEHHSTVVSGHPAGSICPACAPEGLTDDDPQVGTGYPDQDKIILDEIDYKVGGI